MVSQGYTVKTVTDKATLGFLDGYDGLFKAICYSHGRLLYGVNLDIRANGCRVILKTYTNGRAEIAFLNASTLERCFELLTAFIETNAKTGVEWKPDQYYRE